MGEQPQSGIAIPRARLDRLNITAVMQHKNPPHTNVPTQIEAMVEKLAQMHARIAAMASGFKQAPKPPPVDPDSEIARLKKANKNLRIRLRWHEEELLRRSKMPSDTYRAIAKCLHPDYTPSAAERENACKLFNVFWASWNER